MKLEGELRVERNPQPLDVRLMVESVGTEADCEVGWDGGLGPVGKQNPLAFFSC